MPVSWVAAASLESGSARLPSRRVTVCVLRASACRNDARSSGTKFSPIFLIAQSRMKIETHQSKSRKIDDFPDPLLLRESLWKHTGRLAVAKAESNPNRIAANRKIAEPTRAGNHDAARPEVVARRLEFN